MPCSGTKDIESAFAHTSYAHVGHTKINPMNRLYFICMTLPLSLLSLNINHCFQGSQFEKALQWLPVAEHASVLRFKHTTDQHLALGSLLLRRYFFSSFLEIAWKDLCFDRAPKGKPRVQHKDGLWIDYNTSHEGSWVIFVATNRSGLMVGIDCVRITPPRLDTFQFVNQFKPQLSNEEFRWIIAPEDSSSVLRRFYELWACKESYIKATGEGLRHDLCTLSFKNKTEEAVSTEFHHLSRIIMQEEHWGFFLCDIEKDTMAVVCCGYAHQQPLDADLQEFCSTTRLLGAAPRPAPFHEVAWQDLQKAAA
ncbi:4'-phosphopantetheinyl transferase superfamily [Spinellus fusiger]|nr:4'-phosphopantetheinyl transferase superfamily [Spinellus fusiger]